jgi:hypothetical protein
MALYPRIVLPMTPTTDNVLTVYRNASFYAFSTGLEWYPTAQDIAKSIDPIRWHRAAGVIAALSPMNGWTNNVRKAIQLYSQGNGEGCGLYRNVDKAMRIYNGEDALDVLGGDKVRAFYLSIVEPTGDVTPVIDRHAFDIAVGMRTNDAARGILGRKGMYDAFADVYREAADIAGIGSAQMQAVTWTAWRETLGIDR